MSCWALLCWHTAQHPTLESPFTLLYGRDARVPTSLDFYHPTLPMPALETDYAKELFRELKQARQLAQKTIEKSQRQQKIQYDKGARDPQVQEGDLVMLKVEPRFRLDRSYKGPYRVVSVTATNVFIHPLNDPEDQITVSLQRVSKCDNSLANVMPWMGHSKSRRRRQIKRTPVNADQRQGNDDSPPPQTQVTRSEEISIAPPDIFSCLPLWVSQERKGKL